MRRYVKADIVDTKNISDIRERRAAMRQNAKEKKAMAKQDLADQIIEARNADDPLEVLFDLLVPTMGPSKYYGGELVRAMMRILYRDMNDGDVFYDGYGIETCADAVAFLVSEIPELFNEFEDIAHRTLEGSSYTDAITEIADEVTDYIFESSIDEILAPNTKDFQKYDGEELVEANNWAPEYEAECEYPENILYHLDAGHITRSDIEDEMSMWEYLSDADINTSQWGVTVYGLSKEEYLEVNDNLERWLEQWGDDLDSEYGSEEDEDEE